MINTYDGKGGRMLITISSDEQISVAIDHETGVGILEGSKADFQDLLEVLKDVLE